MGFSLALRIGVDHLRTGDIGPSLGDIRSPSSLDANWIIVWDFLTPHF